MKLNQVVAVEKAVKSAANHGIDAVNKAFQKPVLFEGFNKVFKPTREGEDEKPPQSQKVQAKVHEGLSEMARLWTDLIDTAARKDFANCVAKADVKVGDKVLASGVPVTHLLFLEKQLTDLATIVGNAPTLDAAEVWQWDEAAGMHRTAPVMTQSTRKVQQPIVLYPATEKHPAQTQLITEDVVAGNWEMTKFSGAMPGTQKKAMLERIDLLRRAIKEAREEANLIDAEPVRLGAKVFDYILGQ